MSEQDKIIDASNELKMFIETNYKIVDKNSSLVNFRFNSVQADHWSKISDRDIILKARKMGFTSLRLARMIAKCSLQKYRRCVLISHEGEATKRLLKRAHDYLDNARWKVKTGKKGVGEITFPDTKSSLWIGTAGQKAFGRGDDITDFHASEFAFWEKADLLTGLQEACVNESEGCIESTANGWGTMYHKLWNRAEGSEDKDSVGIYGDEAEEDENIAFYKPHFYAWFNDPLYKINVNRSLELDEYERNLKERFGVTDAQFMWRRSKIASMLEPEKFPQEYPATPEEAFLVSGKMVFDAQAIRMQEETRRPILWRGEIKDTGTDTELVARDRGRFRIWVPPRDGDSYIITADVAAGIEGECYSVADVYDAKTWEQVAQWHGHAIPDDFADILMMVGSFYNWGFLAPEVNNHGLTTCTRIARAIYPNFITRKDKRGGSDLGWYTTPGEGGTRAELINAGRVAMKEHACKINSPITLHEMRSFITHDNGKTGASAGSFDDAVIAYGIGMVMLQERGLAPEHNRVSGNDHLSMGGTRRKLIAGLGRIKRAFKGYS